MASQDTRASLTPSPTIAAPDATSPRNAAAGAATANDTLAAKDVGEITQVCPSITNAHTVTEGSSRRPPAQLLGQKSPDLPTSAEWQRSPCPSTPQERHSRSNSSSKNEKDSTDTSGGSGSVLPLPSAATESLSVPSTAKSCDGESNLSNNNSSKDDISSGSSSGSSNSNSGNCNSSSSNTSSSGTSRDSDNGQTTRYGIPSGEESMKALRRHVELLMDREVNARTRSRLEACLDALEPETLDLQLLRVICAKGLPEGCAALRSIYWRLLLHCLPPRPAEWQQRRCKLREAYESYKAEFIREPEAVRRLRRMQQQQQEQQRNQQQQDGKDGADEAKDKLSTAVDEGNTTASRDRQTSSCGSSTEGTRHQSDSSIPLSAVKDHPLCRSATSEWRGYWVDAEVFDQINKDVFRTRPELCFFALNPQQTVTRQQQLHLYPPPPTRHAQPQQQQQNEQVPLLVNYDVLLQQQQQHEQRQSSASSNPAGEGTRAGRKQGSSSSGNTSSSSLKGFRLPSAFRAKKRLVADTASATPPNESARSSSSGSSRGPAACGGSGVSRRGSPSLQAAGRGGCSTRQQSVKVGAKSGDGDDKMIFPSSSSECLLEGGSSELHGSSSRSGCSSSRQFLCAADALETSVAVEQEGYLLDRQLDPAQNKAGVRNASTNSRGSSKSSSSPQDPRLSSRGSHESDSPPLRGQAVSQRSSMTSFQEAEKGRQLLQSLPAAATDPAAVDADAEAAVVARAAGKEPGFPLPSEYLEDCAAAATDATEGGSGVAAAEQQRKGGDTVQPWRAPAGVQDVCNMITPHRHYDVLSRLLFIYAKVNAGLCYVQGMNEILAPIYYALMTDPTYTDYEQAEAEIFYCFSEVMQQQRDAFCKALDPTDAGVKGRLSSLDALLRQKDEEVWVHLNAVGVEPQFYALRWLLLMLTQEFEMPDVLALWDGFIADTGRPLPLLYYVCVAIIIWLRPALLAGDFTACMKLLQHLPSFDPKALLSSAMRLRADDVEGNRTPACGVPRPVPGGGRRSREGLDELDPLQQVSDSLFKPISRAIAALSLNEGLGAVPSETVRPDGGVTEALGERTWKKGIFLPHSLRGEGSASKGDKDAGEGPDAALGHLKRLAGVGVEHAYRGASAVSQYLNNSGLASGIASNITSFFAGDSTPSSAAAPPETTEALAAAERPRQSTAAKLGEFFAAAQSGFSPGVKGTNDSRMRPDKAPFVSPAPDTGDNVGCAPPLIEYPFSPVEVAVSETAEQLPMTEDSLRDISPRQRSLWETDTAEALGRRIKDADGEADSPRSEDDQHSFKSPAGEGLRITIL